MGKRQYPYLAVQFKVGAWPQQQGPVLRTGTGECLLCAKHHSECSTCVDSSNPHSIPRIQVLLLFSFEMI